MKLATFILSLIILMSCTKEKKFTRTIQSKWKIDKITTFEVFACGGGINLLSQQEDAGKLIFTDKKLDYSVPYQTSDDIYAGRFEFSDGTVKEFEYEYLYILALDGYDIILHTPEYKNLHLELLTKDRWEFSTYSDNGCYYIQENYSLSK